MEEHQSRQVSEAGPFDALQPKRAVAYIRVSTRDQAERDGHREGFSIPAQRQAIRRKAEELGSLVIKDFIDPGRTGRTMDRPKLQQMLGYLRETPGIELVIVHKLDRLARSRAGDVEVSQAITQAGARLVSTSENIDESPAGMLLHGIMASIAEFYSQNLATEVAKGMKQKAEHGGTLCRAPIGYLNRRLLDADGRERRDVIVDPERAPLVQDAFRLYATGEWALGELAQHLTRQGLHSRQTPHQASRPITRSSLQVILTNPYYRGLVCFQGRRYSCVHPPLVTVEIWERTQAILRSHRHGERTRTHPHYLTSSIFCGECGRRLIVHHARSRSERIYPYFTCRTPKRSCSQSVWRIEEVEQAIATTYRQVRTPLSLVASYQLPAQSLSECYRDAPPAVRRLLNQALFDRILIDHRAA